MTSRDETDAELIDEDGYPADTALDRISTFTGTAEEMAAYVQSLMHNGHAMVEDFVDDLIHRPGKRLTLITGGWSGCESVIGALRGTMFHLLGWESSCRGGRHTFTFTPEQWAMEFQWGAPEAARQEPAQPIAVSSDGTRAAVEGLLELAVLPDGSAQINLAGKHVEVERRGLQYVVRHETDSIQFGAGLVQA